MVVVVPRRTDMGKILGLITLHDTCAPKCPLQKTVNDNSCLHNKSSRVSPFHFNNGGHELPDCMKRVIANLFWLLLAAAGGWAFAVLTTHRGEALNSVYILIAALCSYALGYRFYSKWIAARVLTLNDRRATPCVVNDDGRDFVKTNKWIVFGHHFAAISGPGPLVGPVLAAQFGYLPGVLWILIGVVLGGAVRDFVILFSSLRRSAEIRLGGWLRRR